MKDKILICLVVLTTILCCFSVVSAQSADTVKLGEITSTNFDFVQSYSGAGNSFSISNDGSVSPNANSKLDLDYNFTIGIDISSLDDKIKSSLSSISSNDDLKCDFVISDGESQYEFENVSCSADVDGDTLNINGSQYAMGLHGVAVDLNNCDIIKCALAVDDNGKVTIYETPEK